MTSVNTGEGGDTTIQPGHARRLFSCAHVHRAAACHARRMEPRKAASGGARAIAAFNAQAFLDSAGIAKNVVAYGREETIFTQGDACEDVLYIQSGGVKLS